MMPHEWFLLIDEARPGWMNMARDQALLDLAERDGAAVLRLYRWDPFCLSFGRHEPARKRYDRDRIAELGLDCVRRPTGGRAVWHARELTYSITAPVAVFGSLPQAYQRMHLIIAGAVPSLGAVPALAATPARATGVDAAACFASPAGGEVVVGDHKLVGSAQLRQGNAFLQHGSLLLEDDQQVVHQVTRGTPPVSLDRPLTRILDRAVGFDEMASALVRSFEAWAGPILGRDDEPGLVRAARQHEARFRDPEWTWSR
jgi:lipoate-protein ligase A